MTKAYVDRSKENLERIARESFSIMEMMRRLGYRAIAGGSHVCLKKRLEKLGIDTSHFLGVRRNSGVNHKGGCRKLSPQEVLVLNRCNKRKEGINKLRRALLATGRKYQCEICHNDGTWRDRVIVLVIDHIDGNALNNVVENLRFLCPNCHSQTDNFAGKNTVRVIRQCSVCGALVNKHNKSGRCHRHWGLVSKKNANIPFGVQVEGTQQTISEAWRQRSRLDKRKFEASKEELEALVQAMPMTHVCKRFGVSDVAVRKRCVRLGVNLNTRFARKRYARVAERQTLKL